MAQRVDKKVLYIVTDSLSLHSHLSPQLKSLADAGWRVGVVCGGDKVLLSKIDLHGTDVYYVPLRREIHLFSDLLAQFLLIALLWRIRPSIVNAGTAKAGLIGMIAAWFTRVPVRVYQLHGIRLETSTGWRRRLLLLTERIACRCAHKVLCVSEGVKRKASELGFCPASKLVSLGSGSCSGVEPADYTLTADRYAAALALRHQLRIPLDAPVVGFIGRLTRDKGIIELLQSFSVITCLLPRTHLLLTGPFEAGDPIPAPTRESILTHPNIRHVPWAQDPRPYLHMMDVLVLPTYREGLPGVLLEAGAAEKPVVSTYATGVIDVIVDQVTGFLCPIGDSARLAERTLKLLLDPTLARRMGRAGRVKVETAFARALVLKNLRAFYEECLESAPQGFACKADIRQMGLSAEE
jgi:glycosyltransferase involved in cell wall biosynthesis